MKTCTKCGIEKSPEEFYRRSKGGRCSDCRECRSTYERERYRKNPEKLRTRQLKCAYGITDSDYERMLAAQDGVCAICSRTCRTGKRLSVDHDHTTGEVRALLCSNCNRGIGLLRDDRILCDRASAYLRRHELAPLTGSPTT